MASHNEGTFNIGHPARDRAEVGLGVLTLALLGAPAAWSVQHLALDALASLACSGELQGALGAAQDWLSWVLPLINLSALLAAGLATALAACILRRTRGENTGGAGDMLDASEGRTRFLAIWGIWLGVVSMLAIAFTTIAVFWVELCTG
jgi:hypothetical protein